MKRELKWLNGELGAARDIDVAIERLTALGQARHPIAQAWFWNEKRADSYRDLARSLRSARYRRLMESATAWIENGPWSMQGGKRATRARTTPIATYCARKLTKWQKRLLRRSHGLRRMGTKKRHRLRVLNKKLRYSMEFFQEVLPDSRTTGKNFPLKHLRVAQAALGELNDGARTRSLARSLEQDGARTKRVLSREREKRLLRKASAAYRKLRQVRKAVARYRYRQIAQGYIGMTAFSTPGRFFKGNLHTHSTRSDGARDPESVCAAYREAGYDFLALTDHFLAKYGFPVVDTRTVSNQRLRRCSAPRCTRRGPALASSGTSCPSVFRSISSRPARPSSAPALAQRCANAGAFVAIAHPAWYGLTVDDAETIGCAHAVEIYNHTSAVRTDRGDGWYLLDQLLARGKRLTGCANDDAHFKCDDAFGGWVMVKAETNEPELLLAALKAGDYYSSQGPLIHDMQGRARRNRNPLLEGRRRDAARPGIARRTDIGARARARSAAERKIQGRLRARRRRR